MFWVELPPIALLIPAIIYNGTSDGLMKLYPLIIALSATVIFLALYIYKAVSISFEEIRCVGVFSSKEKAVIKQDRALVITLLKKNRIRLELFGKNNDGETSYAWLKDDEPCEINLFREKINGSAKRAKKILRYFGVEEEQIEGIFDKNDAEFITEDINLSSVTKDGLKSIKIYFNKTL